MKMDLLLEIKRQVILIRMANTYLVQLVNPKRTQIDIKIKYYQAIIL